MSRFRFCPNEIDKPLLMWGERWSGVDVIALVVHLKGYTAECKLEERALLILESPPISALSSDCELKPTAPFVEEFMEAHTDNWGRAR